MATMLLRDVLTCPTCGGTMFPVSFDRQQKRIAYRCALTPCAMEQVCDFAQVRLADNERFSYFCLNDDGEVTWKCPIHGYGDYDMDSFLKFDITKVQRCCCVLGLDEEEIQTDIAYADMEGRTRIAQLLAPLDKDTLALLAEEQLEDITLEDFDGDAVEAFVLQAKLCEDGAEDFIATLEDSIQALLEDACC